MGQATAPPLLRWCLWSSIPPCLWCSASDQGLCSPELWSSPTSIWQECFVLVFLPRNFYKRYEWTSIFYVFNLYFKETNKRNRPNCDGRSWSILGSVFYWVMIIYHIFKWFYLRNEKWCTSNRCGISKKRNQIYFPLLTTLDIGSYLLYSFFTSTAYKSTIKFSSN